MKGASFILATADRTRERAAVGQRPSIRPDAGRSARPAGDPAGREAKKVETRSEGSPLDYAREPLPPPTGASAGSIAGNLLLGLLFSGLAIGTFMGWPG